MPPCTEMSYNFSSQKKFSTWRKLWIYLAKAEKTLGLDISDEQIKEMESNIPNIDFEKAAANEKLTRHDVMAHVQLFAEQCPKAAPIIHLGATSCFVGDNTDLIVLRDGLNIILPKVAQSIKSLQKFIVEKFDNSAIDTTKLINMNIKIIEWASDLLSDFVRIQHVKDSLRFRGVKGTTGTQGSFLSLFDGDYSKVVQLDKLVTEMSGFQRSLLICGQTYSRRTDVVISSCLSSLCDTVYKIADDLSKFAEGELLSSCMQCCTLAKVSISHLPVFLNTLSTQWLERTLDDSACRRISLAESFLCIDGMIEIFLHLTNDSVVVKNALNHFAEGQKSTLSASSTQVMEIMKTLHNQQVQVFLKELEAVVNH